MRNTRKLKKLQKQMDNATSYDEWSEAAQEHDELTGEKRWRQVDHTRQYDYAQIRLRLDKLRSLRARHDYQGLLFTLNEGIHGNMGGMGRHSLYSHAKFGTKVLIEQYIDEVDDSLRFLAELQTDQISVQEKLDFFYRANICFGRSALMLSGGGVLGFYHLGVVKTLLDQGLLPRVVSGSSAGSLVAGTLGTHTDEELDRFYQPANVLTEAEREASAFTRMFFGANAQIDVGDLEKLIARMIPDLTFQEAYEKTGRQISISVAPAELHQRSRLLNAITSPNVYVRSAVMASCAVPGVFPPVMLMAKNQHGERQPYLPTRKGRELLNFYRGMVQNRSETWPRFNMLMSSVHALMDQEYSGDINIVPKFRWYNPAKLLSHLSEKDLIALMEGGERSTYPAVEAIRTCTKISRTMEEILNRFEQGDLRPDKSEYHRPRSSRRRPPPTRADREAMREHRLHSGNIEKSSGSKIAAPQTKNAGQA